MHVVTTYFNWELFHHDFLQLEFESWKWVVPEVYLSKGGLSSEEYE